MLPFFPFIANQGNNGAPNTPQQQVNGNSSNGMPNFMPAQGQSQVGFNPNPRNPAPFNNPNPAMGQGNQGSYGGFGQQNINALGGYPMGNLLAQNLLSGLLANGAMNPNAGLVNAQLALQNQLQSVNQLLTMALTNPSQLGSFNPMAACGNQGAQGVFPQNGTFPGNPQLGMLQPNGVGQQVNLGQQNTFRPTMNGSASNQFPAPNGVGQQANPGQKNSFRPMMNGNAPPNQQMQMNSFLPSSAGSPLPQNSQAVNSQHQGTQGNRDSMNLSSPNHRQNRTFNRGGRTSNWRDRSQNGQNQYPQKMNGKQHFSNGSREIGNTRDAGTELMHNPKNELNGGKKRSLAMHYSEKEIQQWREERKKFYPTKANVQKKQLPDGKSSGDAEHEAELRRQQLKTILAKQAELGFEVPEIPPHYLSDGEKNHGNDQRKRPFQQNDRFNNKRGRFNGREPYKTRGGPTNRDNFGKRGGCFGSRQQRHNNGNGSWKNDTSTREPTLLEKLMASDLKRDRCQLLQAFRFMVMNSFFEDDSTPLKFPEVLVKEISSEVADIAKIEELVADEDGCGDEIVKCEAEEGEVTD